MLRIVENVPVLGKICRLAYIKLLVLEFMLADFQIIYGQKSFITRQMPRLTAF
jgi:hypothetical protein